MPASVDDIDTIVEDIRSRVAQPTAQRSFLVGLSGIDASGKSFISGHLVQRLNDSGMKTAAIHGDGWLNLPQVRFDSRYSAEHFYQHALRFEAMFQQMILPLKTHRSHQGVMDFVEETAVEYRKEPYAFNDVDIIVVECIFLFKPAWRDHFDLKVWVDCSFEVALERAIARAQEGLGAAETVRAYNKIYFPAQRIHFRNDDPRRCADWILRNDGSLRL